MTRSITLGFCAVIACAIGGCAPDYSPNTYNTAAVQQANKVDNGIVIGFREVKISVDGTVGAVTGGAVGGILGAQTNSPAVSTALTALGGSVVGGVIGTTVEHATGDTTGWEYIVREPKGELISVTQREPTPIPIGQKVLVIEGKQARIVPDYASTAFDAPPAAPEQNKPATSATAPAAPATTPAATAVEAPPAATSATAGSGDKSVSPPPATPPSDAATLPSAPAVAPADAPRPAAAGSGDSAAPPPS